MERKFECRAKGMVEGGKQSKSGEKGGGGIGLGVVMYVYGCVLVCVGV